MHKKKTFDRWAYSVCVCVCVLHREWTANWAQCRRRLMKVRAPFLSSPVCTSNLMSLSSCSQVRWQLTETLRMLHYIVYWLLCELLAKLNEKDTATVRICIIPLHSLRGSWTLLICLHLLNTGENMQMLVMGPNDWPNVNSSWTFTGVDTIFRD